MRKLLLGLMLAGAFGTASAGDLNAVTASRYADSDDFSAKAYYTLAFGGTQRYAHSVGLRFDNERLAAHGAPALFQAGFDGQGNLAALKMNGVDLRGAALAAGQSEGGGLFAGMTTVELVGLAAAGVLFVVVANDVGEGDTEPARGTGGS